MHENVVLSNASLTIDDVIMEGFFLSLLVWCVTLKVSDGKPHCIPERCPVHA